MTRVCARTIRKWSRPWCKRSDGAGAMPIKEFTRQNEASSAPCLLAAATMPVFFGCFPPLPPPLPFFGFLPLFASCPRAHHLYGTSGSVLRVSRRGAFPRTAIQIPTARGLPLGFVAEKPRQFRLFVALVKLRGYGKSVFPRGSLLGAWSLAIHTVFLS